MTAQPMRDAFEAAFQQDMERGQDPSTGAVYYWPYTPEEKETAQRWFSAGYQAGAASLYAARAGQQWQAVAWMHTVTNDGGATTDQALSFKPDNFPLQSEKHGDGLFVSVGQPRPLLYATPPPAGAPPSAA